MEAIIIDFGGRIFRFSVKIRRVRTNLYPDALNGRIIRVRRIMHCDEG